MYLRACVFIFDSLFNIKERQNQTKTNKLYRKIPITVNWVVTRHSQFRVSMSLDFYVCVFLRACVAVCWYLFEISFVKILVHLFLLKSNDGFACDVRHSKITALKMPKFIASINFRSIVLNFDRLELFFLEWWTNFF